MSLLKFKFDQVSPLFKNLQWLPSALRIMANPLSQLTGFWHLLPSVSWSRFLPFPISSPELWPHGESLMLLEGCTLSDPWALACAVFLFLDPSVCLPGFPFMHSLFLSLDGMSPGKLSAGLGAPLLPEHCPLSRAQILLG